MSSAVDGPNRVSATSCSCSVALSALSCSVSSTPSPDAPRVTPPLSEPAWSGGGAGSSWFWKSLRTCHVPINPHEISTSPSY